MVKTSPLKISFLDVGHGDSIVLSIKDKNNINRGIIIDSPDGIKTYKYIIDNDIKIIDYIVITHFHTDHYRGINTLIDKLISNGISVVNVCWEKDKVYREAKDQKTYKDFTDRLYQRHLSDGIGCVPKRFSGNDYPKFNIEDTEELNVSIIYPDNLAANYNSDKNINNTSTVLEVIYNKKRIILPGDLEGEGWYSLRRYINDLKCDILKMPHHGGDFDNSDNSMSIEEVIDCTLPKFAVISTAQNEKYNHPSERTVNYLSSNKVNTLCTQVTELCDKNRLEKRVCILSKLSNNNKYKKEWCPCAGDIIFEIDDEIQIVSHPNNLLTDIKKTFSERKCIIIEE